MACTDQLNLGSLKGSEILVRRAMLIEEAHGQPGAYENADEWMGLGTRKGGVIVTPSLRRHVAARMNERNSIMKEHRKLLEERRLAKGRGKGKDKNAPTPAEPGAKV